MRRQAREREKRGQHGAAMVFFYLGTVGCKARKRGSSGLAAAIPPSWRCTEESGVRERL